MPPLSANRHPQRETGAGGCLPELAEEDSWGALFAGMSDGCAVGEALFDAAGKAIDLRLLNMNPVFEQQSGWSRALLGQAVSSWLPDMSAFGMERCLDVAATGAPARIEYCNPDDGCCYEIRACRHRAGGFILLCRDSSEQQRREQALRERERNTWRILESLPGLIWTATARGEVDFVSPQWSAYTGTPGLGRLGKRWTKVVHPDDRADAYAAWHAAVTERHGWNHECRLRSRDGSYRWFSWRGAPIRDASGKVARWFGMFTDIDDLKRVQEDLRRSKNVLRATFEQAVVGIAHINPQGFFIRANHSLCNMLGYTEEELCSKTIIDITYFPDRNIGIDEFKRAIAGEISNYIIEKRYQRRDGGIVWVRISVSAVRDHGRSSYNVAVIEDITARREAEQDREMMMEQLHHAVAEANHNRANMEAIFQSIDDGISVFDMDGQLRLRNAALARIFGYPSMEDLLGPIQDFLQSYEMRLPDGTPVPLEQWPVSRALRGETFSDWELSVHRRDIERNMFCSFSGAPVYDENGRQSMAVVISRDISERKQLEQTRQEAERRLLLAVDIAHVGFWEWHVPENNCYFSPQWKKQLGYRDDELPSRAEEWRSRLHPEDVGRVEHEIGAFIANPQPGYRLEYRLRHRDGSYRWMIANAVVSGNRNNMTLIGTQLDITDSKLAEQRVRAAAQHDPLTGLPNRALAFEYAGHLLAAARRNHSQGAFLFIDLDRFKPVNDLYGHETGDRLLQEVARRLKSCVRSEDLVGRLGGDEVVIVLPHAGHHHPATAAAQHVIDALSSPFEIDALDLSISASVGISHFPAHGTDVDALLHAADLAMYQAKHGRHGRYAVYTPELDSHADAASSIEARLKRALKRNGLALHYQPVIDMKSGGVIGAEALLRLRPEGDKEIGPDRFVPIAESSGLIGDLGEWVAAEACRQHEAWRRQGLPPVTIAINVSPLQFRQRGFARRLQDIILDSSVDPAYIQIEVTESTVMESVEDAIETLRGIRAAGIRIALDDFGTGYSSLSHLSNLPLDKLKVDQSFVKRLEHDRASRAITGAIIALGRTLNLEVVGEGIESQDALEYLQEHGCDQAQGFFISQPLAPERFAEWYRGRYMQ